MRDHRGPCASSVREVRQAPFPVRPGSDRKSSGHPHQDGEDSVWTAFGRAHAILDNLIAEKTIPPMVIEAVLVAILLIARRRLG